MAIPQRSGAQSERGRRSQDSGSRSALARRDTHAETVDCDSNPASAGTRHGPNGHQVAAGAAAAGVEAAGGWGYCAASAARASLCQGECEGYEDDGDNYYEQ